MKRFLTAMIFTLSITIGSAFADIDSSSFNGVNNGAVNTAGALDWGYVSFDGGFFDSNLDGQDIGTSYNNTPYGSITRNAGDVLTTVSGSSSIGQVTLTEGIAGTDTVGAQSNDANFTFDGMPSFGSYGNFAPGEQDVWTIKFNDLGIGTFDITLYLAHSATNRGFDFDITLDDGGTIDMDTTTTGGQIGDLGGTLPGIGAGGASFTYDITVTTTTAGADLTLVHGDTGGGSFGGGIFAGYTVFAEGGGGGPDLVGDYNSDNMVDLADYTIWRNTLGDTGLTPFEGADGNGDGSITEADFTVWRANYGDSIGGSVQAATVPEPSTIGLVFLGLVGIWTRIRNSYPV